VGKSDETGVKGKGRMTQRAIGRLMYRGKKGNPNIGKGNPTLFMDRRDRQTQAMKGYIYLARAVRGGWEFEGTTLGFRM